MSHLQIISLFKHRPAEELTRDEVQFVHQYLEEHPELVSLLGGPQVVANYLARATTNDQEHPSADTQEPTPAIPAPGDIPARPWIFRITALLILLLIGWSGWFGWQQFSNQQQHVVTSETNPGPTTGKTDKKKKTDDHTLDPKKNKQWNGWDIAHADESPILFQPSWNFSEQGKPIATMVPVTGSQITTFSVSRRAGPDDWLAFQLNPVEKEASTGTVEIRINDTIYNRVPVPGAGTKDPYLVPLHDYSDQQIQLQLTYHPGDTEEKVTWNRLEFFQQPLSTQWQPVEIVAVQSQAGTKIAVGPDGIITAERGGPGIETYVAHIKAPLPEITAFRLEAFPDQDGSKTRQRRTGKWHFMQTSFVLSNFRVRTVATEQQPMRGRYVQIISRDDRAYLSLAEVQVFSGKENVALKGIASQSTPDERMGASMAIDNRLTADGYRDQNGKYARSMIRTRGRKDKAWWEVDLGKDHDIDRIVIHSPTTYNVRVTPFYVKVLGHPRNPETDLVWQSDLIDQHPSPSLEVADSNSQELAFRNASTSQRDHQDMVGDSLKASQTGWNLPEYFHHPQEAIFTLEESTPVNSNGFLVYLGHSMHSRAPTLGKFRLSATNLSPPFQYAPAGTVVWAQDATPGSTDARPAMPAEPALTVQQSPVKPLPMPAVEAGNPVDQEAAARAQAAQEKATRLQEAAQQKAQEADRIARQKADEARKLAQKRETEARQLAQKRKIEANRLKQQRESEARRLKQQQAAEERRVAQQKRLAEQKKAREQRAAEAKKRAEALAARRKADTLKRQQDALKRAADAKQRAEAAQREREAKKKAEQAKNPSS